MSTYRGAKDAVEANEALIELVANDAVATDIDDVWLLRTNEDVCALVTNELVCELST